MNPRLDPVQAAAAENALRLIHLIGGGTALPAAATPAALGFKAWSLARMAALGLPVPPAFVLGTGWCGRAEVGPQLWQGALQELERFTGLGLGNTRHPLLLSVRSGAAVSMPGMMETLLNIGLTDATLPGLVRLTGHPRLTWDAYRRLIAGYGEVVAGIDAQHFEADLDAVRADSDERELDFSALREVANRHQATYAREAGEAFPQDAQVQLREAIAAVFASWHSDKAHAYRELHGLPHSMGTAVTVQRMVFGNAGGMSGSGVGFTRNPISGEPVPWVDFLFNAQGEDVVSGRRSAQGHDELAAVAPQVWDSLLRATVQLERAFGDMQDFEFTVQDGQLYLLQTRGGKRTPQAAARIALDLCDQGVITQEVALARTRTLDAQALVLRVVAAEDGKTLAPLAHAASAASGVVCGEIALDEARVRERKAAGATVVLVRRDAETRDIAALDLADGLLTQRGARTSHAAVVARQLGKVCLVGCESLAINELERVLSIGGLDLREGDPITLDGNEGVLYAGTTRVEERIPQELLDRLDRLRSSHG
ncbi:PEP/pyruvate-binding domain-containing protein [Pseudomonas sp. 2FE]|uniref:PEP/pyruvate-binding domain-containing protein n=1 Tax=Pseudomonas sp. 2FE TaxID=2502190 RepID=UPI0010F5CAD0|nr:PEP/pyruvate-binding domain-containing protein [Pseudomonas sp. 2FE]